MGYYGGHSMAIAVGTTFVENGYMESGIELGTTFATVGLLWRRDLGYDHHQPRGQKRQDQHQDED